MAELSRFQQRIMDSLGTQITATGRIVRAMQGSVAGDLYNIQQQLVQVQELTGQSQQRLNELRGQLETRGEELNQGGPPADTAAQAAPPASGSAAPAGGPPPAPEEQMYQASLQQLRQGSVSTARLGFRELLRSYPNGHQGADALYFIGESYAGDTPDSAAAYYQQVVTSYPVHLAGAQRALQTRPAGRAAARSPRLPGPSTSGWTRSTHGQTKRRWRGTS